ncbi:MAG TPA: transglutaminase-like domain-containing protein [Chitinophagaceae bacterium]|nr:transglutaminase-like domain-containing protein [Chitinophagaceae bacterium]
MNPATRILLLSLFWTIWSGKSHSQSDYTNMVSGWKAQFPKEDVIAASFKQTISFTLSTNPVPGSAAVNAKVASEITLVPVKDFIKFKDGLFYYDEVTVDNIHSVNSKNKELVIEKLCGPYHDEDVFHSDTRFCSVVFPLEEKGKACHYRYENNYRDIKYMTSFYFNESLPVVEGSIEFIIPSWLEIDLREFNFRNNNIERKETKENDLTHITYTVRNMPAFQEESSSPNHALSHPHIIAVSKAYTRNGERKVLFESVKDLYGWYSEVCSDIGNKPAELKDKVTELTAGKTTDRERIESIFYWVQDKIRYIAFENGIMGFKPDAAQNVYKNKYGDCKGKANLLKEMLKVAGYDARLTWIGTSDLPYDYSLPSLAVDNHMICTLILNGKRYFLDGTEPFIALDDYAQRIQGKQVLIEDGKNYILDRIPDFPAERNKVKKVTKLTLDNDDLSGNSVVEFNGESRIMLQSIYQSTRNEEKKKSLSGFLRHEDDNIVIQDMKTPDFNDRQRPLTLNFDFKAHHQVTRTGNELYVVMDWDKEFSGFEFDNDRKNDYELSYKYYINTQAELSVPDGYKVNYLPSSFKKSGPNYSFEGSFVNKGKTVIYNKVIIINKPILLKSDFQDWNAFIKEINNFYNDQVVLIKQ